MLKLTATDPAQIETPLLVVPICKDADLHANATLLNTVLGVRKLEEFSGAEGDRVTLYQPAAFRAERLMFIGLGDLKKLDGKTFREAAGAAVGQAIKSHLKHLALVVPDAVEVPLDFAATLEAMLEGGCLANHRFDRYKQEQKYHSLKQIDFVVPEKATRRYRKRMKQIETICTATLLARDWVNVPSNEKTPYDLAQNIVRLAKEENLKTTLLGKKELMRQKFGAILAVSAGSDHEPAMVVLDYYPKNARQTVVLVGKGVTFDSGGLNLKTTQTINMMKVDMAGAAAVAATLVTMARLRPKIRVVGVMPLVENMISGDATRPGDIIRTYSGKTVEIGNTDAEGRLILGDALAYAQKKFKPDIMIDIATLTGACLIALGDEIAGLFTQDDELAEAILGAARKTHERCWRLPLPDDYREQLKSEVADINNMPKSRYGAAITAALFLSEFVGDARWAHLDIAGPAYRSKASKICGAGGTGFGVRLFCDWLGNL